MAEDELKGLDLKKEEIRKDPKKYIEAYMKIMEEAAKIAGSGDFQFSEVASKIKDEAEHAETVMRISAANSKLNQADELTKAGKTEGATKLAEEAYAILHPPTHETEDEALKAKAISVIERLRDYLGDKVKPTRAPTPPPEHAEPQAAAAAPEAVPGHPAANAPESAPREPERDWRKLAEFSDEEWIQFLRKNGPDKTAFKLAEVAYNLVNIGNTDKAERLVRIAMQIKPKMDEQVVKKIEIFKENIARILHPVPGRPQFRNLVVAEPSARKSDPARDNNARLKAAFNKNILLSMQEDKEKDNKVLDELLKKIFVEKNIETGVNNMGQEFKPVFRNAAESIERYVESSEAGKEAAKSEVFAWLENKKRMLESKAQEKRRMYIEAMNNSAKNPEKGDRMTVAKLLAAMAALDSLKEIVKSL